MSISWVTGTVAVYAVSLTQSVTTPAGIIDGDGLFALVFTRSALTPPAGWTVIASGVGVGGGVSQTLSVCRKTTVVAANSSTAYTWSQATSDRMGVSYAVVRATSAAIGVTASEVFATVSNSATDIVAVPVLTATADGGEVFLVATTASNISNPFTPIPPSGATLFTNNTTENRLGGSYQSRAVGQSNSAPSTISNIGGNLGMVAITLRLREAVVATSITDSGLLLDDFGFSVALLESVGVAPTATTVRKVAGIIATLTSIAFSSADSPVIPTRRRAVVGAEMVGVSPALDLIAYAYAVVEYELQIQQMQGVQGNYQRILVDALVVLEQLLRGQQHTLQDIAEITSVVAGVRTAQILEALRITSVLVSVSRVTSTLTSTTQISDDLLQFFGATSADGVTLTSPVTAGPKYGRSVSEAVAVVETHARTLVLRVVVPDTIHLSEEFIHRWLANPVLQEGVLLDGAFLSPNESLVTWAMNTRSAAVSEYTQYGYTGFTRRGTRYLASSDTGLYVLDGDTDAGEPIIARLRSGMLQMNGSKFSGFKAVYLGVHGTGETLFRVVAGTGEVYTYRVVIQNMQSTKVRMGKGLRARYFAFELETLGADFDLDTVEFIPLTAQRRV